jgi:addiction module RelE/StbE family toxin
LPSGRYKVRWLRAALKNLDAEAEYISRFDFQAATAIVKRIRDAVRHLEVHPAIGRPGRVPETRELVISGTPYIIPYRIKGKQVEILRVFHASRRWPENL